MNVGRSAPRIERIALLYSRSGELQSSIYEYFIVVVGLCQEILQFTKKSALMKFGAALSESRLDKYKADLESWGNTIQDETRFLMAKRNEDEAKANSHFRSMSTRFFKSASNQQKVQERQRVLDFCCRYDYMVSWKQARKTGNTHLFRDCPHYKAWKGHAGSSTLVYTGKLGSGKSVMLANMVDDLHLLAPSGNITVAFFFVRHDVSETLEARTVIGSIVQQLLSPFLDLTMAADLLTTISQMEPFEQMLRILKVVLKPDSKAFVVIDGLDELKGHEQERLLREFHLLQKSFELSLCFSFRQEPNIPLGPRVLRSFNNANVVPIPENTAEIKNFIMEELDRRLESGRLNVRDPVLPLQIRDALMEGSQGMFLWTALQIESLCTMDTDDEMRHALNNLPPDLSETFSRILQRSNKPGSPYQKWILELITVAQRQLTTEEMKEALSVTPGDPDWSPSRLLNNVYRTLAYCGGLVIVDEEEFTLRLVHHSARKYLVGELDNPANAVVDLEKAQKTMSGIIITYLYHSEFGKQVTKNVVPELDAGPALSGIVRSTGYSMDDMSSLALKLLRIESPLEHNIGKTLAQTWRQNQNSKAKAHFRGYAMKFWHSHLTWSLPLLPPVQHLFQKLCERDLLPSIEAPREMELLFGGALATGAVDVVKYLVRTCNVDVNCKMDSRKTTALHFAVTRGMAEIVEVLLEADGIDLKAKNLDGETPMELAAKAGQLSIVQPFLNTGKIDQSASVLSALMYQAAKEGDEALVATLIGHSENTPTHLHGATMWVAIEGATLGAHTSLVRLLLNHHDTPNWKSAFGADNPLHKAVEAGNLEIAECWLDSGKIDPRAVNSQGWPPLFLAAMHGHVDTFMMLLDAEGLIGNRFLGLRQIIHGVTPVHLAAKAGSKAIVELAIAKLYMDPDEPDSQGNTCLHLATEFGRRDLVQFLISQDTIDTKKENSSGVTPLEMAIEGKQCDIINTLLNFNPISSGLEACEGQTFREYSGYTPDERRQSDEWEASIHAKDVQCRTWLHMAVIDGYERATELILMGGADPFQMDWDRLTPLHYAAKLGNEFMMKILLRDPSGPHLCGRKPPVDDGETALHLAVAAGQSEVVQILLSQQPSQAHIPNQRGETPLHIAIRTNQNPIIDLLLMDRSVSIDLGTLDNQTPLHYAARYGNDLAAELLLSRGAAPSSQDSHQSTPLHYAVEVDAVAVARTLLQYDISLANKQDDRGRTALHIAAIQGQLEMVRLILETDSVNTYIQDEIGGTAVQYATRNGYKHIAELIGSTID